MNRRPNQSRTRYDAFFSPSRFTASTPGTDFFDVRRKRPLAARLALYFFLLFLALMLANWAVNQFVRVDRVSVRITGMTEDFDGYTLLHISDLKGAQFGANQQGLSFALGDAEFDAVLLGGDMLSMHENAEPLYALIERLRQLNPRAPIYFIAGDTDPEVTSGAYFSGGSPFAPWVLGAQQRGAQLLSGPQAITRGNQSLWLTTPAQLNMDLDTMQRQYELQYLSALDAGEDNAIDLAKHHLLSLEQTRSARKAMRESDVVIALSHTPLTQEELAACPQIDLSLSGHVLGGLVRLPALGPVFIPSPSLARYGLFPGPGTHYGLRREGRTQLYVSPGLGSANDDYPPFFFRLFNPPTVTLLTLTPSSI